ncbi:MAG: hypothetical protein HYR90_04530 [Candidatus Andersenbacteria bacterium]|nr:hypothetical protein [Candidatus Andersenbacteria bacterium]MBI3250461.1 hypothetical protein [Candidatus Andersenbacteria bacterium]
MTANIQQSIGARYRPARRNFRVSLRKGNSQRGSVSHTTVTLVAGMVALVTVGMLGFLYLRQVVGTASQGTNIRELEAQILDLRDQQRQLELEGAQLRSLQAVEERTQELNLVEADRVSYLATLSDRVALGD